MTDLVKMERDGKTADVHPSEVDNMKAANWIVTEPPKKTVTRTAKTVKSNKAD